MADSSESLDSALAPGMVLDNRYRLLSVIGQGSSGTVYRAELLTLQEVVALKIFRADFLQDEKMIEKALHEARILARLEHPGIVGIKSVVRSDEQVYLVMELLEGQSLKERILQKGPLETYEFVAIFSAICDALSYAHDQNILHRDLKPANIILTNCANGGTVAKLVDFGIAKVAPELTLQGIQSKNTTSSLMRGTPAYMSPEQCRGGKLDLRSDLYSLGCVMFEAATGRQPFCGDSPYAVMQMHLHNQASFKSSDGISQALKDVISQCLSKNAGDRIQSASELKAELAEVKDCESSNCKSTELGARYTKPTLVACCAILLAITLCSIVASRKYHYNGDKDESISVLKATPRTELRRRGAQSIAELNRLAKTQAEAEGEKPSGKAGKMFVDIISNEDQFKKAEISEQISVYMNYADYLRALRKYDECKIYLKKCEEALRLAPEDKMDVHNYYRVLHHYYRDIGDLAAAEKTIVKALTYAKQTLQNEIFWWQGVLSLTDIQVARDGNTQRALATLDQAILECSDGEGNARLVAQVALIALAGGNEKRYNEALQKLKRESTTHAGIELFALSNLLYQKKRFQEALAVCSESTSRLRADCIAHPYDFVRACTLEGLINKNLNRYNEALRCCDAADECLKRLDTPPSELIQEVESIRRSVKQCSNHPELHTGQSI